MEKEITFENNWSVEDKQYFIKYYGPSFRLFSWVLFSLGVFFLITIIFGFVEMHKQFSDFPFILYIDIVILIAFPFLSRIIDKRRLDKVLDKHHSICLHAEGLYVDGKHIDAITQAVISNQFIFFRVGRRSYIQTITKQETDDVMELLKASPVFPIIHTTKTFRITKFALTGRV